MHYDLKVKRYVEVIRTVPVTVVNVPAGKNLLVYPTSVEVSLKCNFPLLDDPDTGLRVEADYNDLQKSLGQRCVLKVISHSRGVISSESMPVSVSCILEDK